MNVRRGALLAILACTATGPVIAHARATPPGKSEARAQARGNAKGKPAPPKKAVTSTTLPRKAVDPDNPHERRISELRERLEALMREPPLSRAKVGAVVMQISDGDVLYSHNAELKFNPASNTKMLTTAAALDRLSGDYRYRTALYGAEADMDGVIAGDVVLRGSSDPSLSSMDLAELARALADRGVTRIRGDLVVDRRPIGWDGVGQDGLILNRNTIAVRVRPTEPKHAPAISLEPAGAGITIENRATTVAGKRTRLKLDTYRKDDHLVIQVKGRIGDARGAVLIGQRVVDGALLCGHTLYAILPDFGITLEGRVRAGDQAVKPGDATDAHADVLATHRSAPLADISRISNKPSNNFVADAIYKTLGGELFGLPGTLQKGSRAVSEWLVERGLDPTHFHLVNGSGLTHENRITPGDLAHLLRVIFFEPALAPEFLPSLAIAGIDGTIRNRFQGTSAVGLVRAKTGTLNGVSALSGYVGEKGDVIVFSILVENIRGNRVKLVRHAQVRLVDAMLRYLRAEAQPGEATHPPPEEPTMPDEEDPSDSESDGDPTP